MMVNVMRRVMGILGGRLTIRSIRPDRLFRAGRRSHPGNLRRPSQVGRTRSGLIPEPVSADSRTGLRVLKTEIGKTRSETGSQNGPVWLQLSLFCASETRVTGANPRNCRALTGPAGRPAGA
jgi:hypothetical protein